MFENEFDLLYEATRDVLAPLREALEGLLTEENKPYVLMSVLLVPVGLVLAAHAMERNEARRRALGGRKKTD